MKLAYLLSTVGFCLLIFKGADGKCPPDNPDDDNLIQYKVISPQNYDRNYSSISSDGKRPLGFDKIVWYYNRPDLSNPCVKITGTIDRRLQIKIETDPTAILCVRKSNTLIGCSESATGRMYKCISPNSNTTYLEFFCNSDQGCGEFDVPAWYRLVIGESAEMDSEDYWCDENQNEDEYPSFLLTLPQNFEYHGPVTTPNPGGAPGCNLPCYWCFGVLLLSSLFFV